MLQIYWFALAAFATLCTWTWLVVEPEEKVYFTAGLGAAAWTFLALTARGVERSLEAGGMEPADAGVIVQLFIGILALLSLLVIVLYRAGLYPPPDDEAPDDGRINA